MDDYFDSRHGRKGRPSVVDLNERVPLHVTPRLTKERENGEAFSAGDLPGRRELRLGTWNAVGALLDREARGPHRTDRSCPRA